MTLICRRHLSLIRPMFTGSLFDFSMPHCMRCIHVSHVAFSVCLSLCVLVTRISSAKTAELIEMPFAGLTQVGSRNHDVLDGVSRCLHGRGKLWRFSDPLKSIPSLCCSACSKIDHWIFSDSPTCGAVRPVVRIRWPLFIFAVLFTRPSRVVGLVCVCVCLFGQDLNKMTFDLDIRRAGSSWHYLGHVWRWLL